MAEPASASKGVQSFRDLVVWQLAIFFTKKVYQLTARFPREEQYGIVSQMRRAALSVPCNISEGQARRSTKEFLQFISHALGSLAEVETQLVLSVELAFCGEADVRELNARAAELRMKLHALRRSLLNAASSDAPA